MCRHYYMKAQKVIITSCLTGTVPGKKDTPYVPVTVKEIIQDALKVARAGATIVHIHPRDEHGRPTWKKSVLEKIIGGIKEKNDRLLISVTTSGRRWKEFDKRSDCLELKGDLKPDFASLTPGSMNFINEESVNTPDMIEKLAAKMMDNGIKPELEIFEPGMIHSVNHLMAKGVIPGKPFFNLFVGSLGTSPLHPSIFAAYLALLPADAVWCGAGIGKFQLAANTVSISYGGGVRVGIEDNIYFDVNKTILASNVMFVDRLVKLIKLLGREVATAGETRSILF